MANTLANNDIDPYLCAIYQEPIFRISDGQYFKSWKNLNDAICDQDREEAQSRFNNSISDLEHGFGNIAMAASSFITDIPNGDAARKFMIDQAVNNPKLKENPKWALVPIDPTLSNFTSQVGDSLYEELWERTEDRQGFYSQSNNRSVSKNALISVNFHPNPIQNTTVIKIDLPYNSDINLRIFDANGKILGTIVDLENQSAGSYSYNWDSAGVPSGIYFAILNGSLVGRLVVQK